MSFVSLTTISLFAALGYAEKFMCTSGECVFSSVQPGDVVICTNQATKCVIQCKDRGQCKKVNKIPFRVFTGCATEVNCDGEESCYGAEFQFGIPYKMALYNPDNMLSGLSDGDFRGPHSGEFTVNCNGKSSCKHASTIVNGMFMDAVTLNANGKDSFKDGKYKCNLGRSEKCDLRCTDPLNSKSCDDSSFTCAYGNDCVCHGGSCPSLVRVCESDPCVIKPAANEIVFCDNQLDECTIDCSYKIDACKFQNGDMFTVYSGANKTRIKCNNENACLKADIFIGNPPNRLKIPRPFTIDNLIGKKQWVDINCNAKSGCKQANFYINGDIGYVNILGESADSIKQANINIDLNNNQIFNLNCGTLGSNSCEKTRCACGDGTNCVCNGESCNAVIKVTPKPTLQPTNKPTPIPVPPPTPRPTSRTWPPTSAPVKRTPPVVVPLSTVVQPQIEIPNIPIPDTPIPDTPIPDTPIPDTPQPQAKQANVAAKVQQSSSKDSLNKLAETYSIISACLLAGFLVFVYWCFKKSKDMKKDNISASLMNRDTKYNTFDNHRKGIELVM